MSGDAYHMTSPPADGAGAALSMRNAIADAGINAEDINYIKAHGTSTLAGDRAECFAVKSVMDSAVDQVSVSTTKSISMYLQDTSGAADAIFISIARHLQMSASTNK